MKERRDLAGVGGELVLGVYLVPAHDTAQVGEHNLYSECHRIRGWSRNSTSDSCDRPQVEDRVRSKFRLIGFGELNRIYSGPDSPQPTNQPKARGKWGFPRNWGPQLDGIQL